MLRNATDGDLQFISRLSQLQALEIKLCNNNSAQGVMYMSQMSGLRALKLFQCTALVDADTAELLSQVPHLHALTLYGGFRLTDDTLLHILRLPALAKLNLGSCSGVADDAA